MYVLNEVLARSRHAELLGEAARERPARRLLRARRAAQRAERAVARASRAASAARYELARAQWSSPVV